MARKCAVVVFALAAAVSPAAAQEPTDAQRAAAAEAFARSLGATDSEVFARAFRRGLEAAYALDETPGRRGKSVRGATSGVESDPRYRRNLAAMLGDAGGKIWGGKRTRAGDFPDVVAIRGGGSICSGTLIAPRVVLTAAHCHCGGVNREVIFGDATGDPGAVRVEALRSEAWIGCDKPERDGDLAIVLLKQDAPVAPRALAPTAWIDAARDVHLVGFGRTEDPVAEPLGIKREVDVPVATANCAGQVALSSGAVADAVFYDCRAGGEVVAGAPLLDRDSCNGDSGGPLFVKGADGKHYLAAATSRAVVRAGLRPCGDGGIYARVDGDGLAWLRSKGVAVTVAAVAPAPAPPADGAGEAAAAGTRLVHASFQPVPAPAAPRTRRSARQARTEGWLLEAGQDPTVSGSIRPQPGGGFAFVPESDPAVAVPLANSAELSRSAVGLPVRMKLETTPGSPDVRAANVQLEAVAQWNEVLPFRRRPFQAVEQAVAELSDSSTQALRAGGMGDADKQLETDVRALEEAVASKYVELQPAQTQERALLKAQLAEARKARKALYARKDIYRPEAYKRIYENSRGAAAIAVKGQPDPFCSAFLVARDAVLTAAHCLDDVESPAELEVRFNYEVDLTGQSLAVDTYPVQAPALAVGGAAFEPGGPNLDFALLRIGTNTAGRLPGEAWPVQCLSGARLGIDEPLYVIGHPQGRPRAVHDNAFVFFPFRATRNEFRYLKALVDAEFRDEPDGSKRIKEFSDSYRERALQTGGSVFENYSLRWEKQPTIGADADTYHGNSGSAVFSRMDHKVVGILFAGEDDVATPYTPGWSAHEAVLPIAPVVDQLDRVLPAWRQLQGLCAPAP